MLVKEATDVKLGSCGCGCDMVCIIKFQHNLVFIYCWHKVHLAFHMIAGPRLNIKTVLSRYGYSYVKDKTAVRTSYL